MSKNYKITRIYPNNKQYLGTYTNFSSVDYKLDEYGEPDNDIHDWPPRLNEGVALNGNLSNCDRCYTYWRTTQVTDIEVLNDNICIFNTKNSHYEIELV